VNLGVETYNMIPRSNGETCAIIALYQAPGSNAVELAENVITEMEVLSKNFPESIVYEVGLDTTLPITAGIKDIVVTLIIALILVILVVFIFIQDWRATLIPTLAIPVSLVGAFIFFPALGFTINVLSLLGLVLAIGIVVRCDGCIAFHVHDAIKAGATYDEIVDAIGVAILMGGAPAVVYGSQALEALKQFKGEATPAMQKD